MKRWIVMLLCALGTEGVVADTVQIERVDFDQSIRVGDQAFQLHGVGLLRYRIVFRAYVGALYLGEGRSIDDLWEEGMPIRLELEYFWSIAGDQFGPAAEPFLKRNMTSEELASICDRVDQLSKLYRDVSPGDRYALTFIPGVGTELALNGTPLGVIEGDDFSRLYFRIWLGSDPLDRRFRDQLIAGK